MRNTREFHLEPRGKMTAIEGAGILSDDVVAPCDCELVAVAVWFDKVLATTAAVDVTFDVLVNGAEVGTGNVDLRVAEGEKSGRFGLDGKVFLLKGQRIELQSNGEQDTVATDCWVTLIFTSVNRDTRIVSLPAAILVDIDDTSTESAAILAPFDCEVVSITANFNEEIDAAHTFDMLIDGAAVPHGAVDLIVPDESNFGEYPFDGVVYAAKGQKLSITSNQETTTADTDMVFAFNLRPMSQRPMGDDYYYDSMAAIESASVAGGMVMAENCKVISAFFKPDAAIATAAVLGAHMEIDVNEVTTGTSDLTVPELTAADATTPEIFLAVNGIQVLAAGDMVQLSSDAEQVLACDLEYVLITRPI